QAAAAGGAGRDVADARLLLLRPPAPPPREHGREPEVPRSTRDRAARGADADLRGGPRRTRALALLDRAQRDVGGRPGRRRPPAGVGAGRRAGLAERPLPLARRELAPADP